MAAFTLQQALSGQLSACGQVAALSSGCTAASQSITATATHLPADFSSATVYCSLVAPQLLTSWQDQLQVNDADLSFEFDMYNLFLGYGIKPGSYVEEALSYVCSFLVCREVMYGRKLYRFQL